MKITSDENVNQAVEQMVQAIRNTDAYMEYRRQLGRIKEQPELKKQIDSSDVLMLSSEDQFRQDRSVHQRE